MSQLETTKVVNKAERTISTKYTQGTYRVTVRSRYSKGSKRYISVVQESRLEISPEWTTEISQLNLGFGTQRPEDDFYRIIWDEPAARYNAAVLDDTHSKAVAYAQDIVQQLLEKGKTNSELHGAY